MQEFFQGARFWVPEKLFIPSKCKDPEFYKEYIIKENEDMDWDGNKGNFKHHKDFSIAILYNTQEKT